MTPTTVQKSKILDILEIQSNTSRAIVVGLLEMVEFKMFMAVQYGSRGGSFDVRLPTNNSGAMYALARSCLYPK